MRNLLAAAFAAGFVAFAWYTLPTAPRPEAGRLGGGHADHAGDPAAFAEGVVLSVERAAMNVTISHGPLQNLGMPAMTMGFRVADAASLARIKAGDKVRFHADVVGGEFVVMSIEAER